MSDSHIYELEDIVWDDFSISDDHLVPHCKIEQNERSTFQAESHKKLKHEVRMTSNTCSYGLAAGETSMCSPIIKGEQVLANSSWYCNSNTFQTFKELMPCLSFGGPTVASSDFTSNNNILTVDPSPTAANNCVTAGESGSYSLSDVHQSESNLSFLSNGRENYESDDSLFYEWPDIGSFEDVDQLLRTCNSTFGLGDLGKEDDMCWASSSTTMSSCDAASKIKASSSAFDSDSLKFVSENSESPHDPNSVSSAVDALNKGSGGAINTSLASNTHEHSRLSKAASTVAAQNLNDINEEKCLKKISNNKNSEVEKIGIEETSFLQLQEVIQQLDLNTKLRIRDSLYRLARSAEQRHGIATTSNKADKYSSEALTAETKCAGLLDIETDTNPVDRIIAHLLFHRPNDPSKKSLTDPQSQNDASNSMNMSPPDDLKVALKLESNTTTTTTVHHVLKILETTTTTT